ncbi:MULTISPECIES: guanosine-5'-triphosphate,3'-diphosphate pyrophosphatase [Gammaproteobacteria]|uniref:Ppx/GppA phosphatase family protein n=1 Tax=Gammaproteobacteria TaxID=1236 RepID=UPI000F801D27|nr:MULTISPECIES: guanosine-5'-triphosphate,3'-diphosphate pyrophosphatase [Gammaproteobacteria]RTE85757.1 guanosine-5'-triphosphate,3'-diphosphate pyrophosphatase [Aliidiomarina sp. B3213]TCZ90240.1 guanosine-5'-triphosphate,3'-diphosphate pyrophosphatase [Lysobacter sp. N42]
MRSKEYYAAIDLGSNSFHMLVVRVVAGSIQIVSKIKRKIRLAEGLDEQGNLAADAQQRALDCLAIFADRVNDIAPENISAVGTAALRQLDPQDPFLDTMQEVLGHPIKIIPGEVEAQTIYQGIAHTTATNHSLMVCDIGGASTELAIGEGYIPKSVKSLPMGCVTWKQRYFPEGVIEQANIDKAVAAAEAVVAPYVQQFEKASELRVLGASGTFKALQDIARHRQQSEVFQLDWLEEMLHEAAQFEHLDELNVPGLKPDRVLVFLPGVCILIGIFKQLKLQGVEATEAALREGLIYGMLTELQHDDVQLRTLESLSEHYQIDANQTIRVLTVFQNFEQQLNNSMLQDETVASVARAVAYLHEIGLSMSYKKAGRHSRYVLKNTNLPGFSLREREALLEVLEGVGGTIDEDSTPDKLPAEPQFALLTRLLRLAILLCQRRNNDRVPSVKLSLKGTQLSVQLPKGFFHENRYLASLLLEEERFQSQFGGLELFE